MDILYSVDEKYLQAVEELNYGELPKALRYFNDLVETEADHARAHYHLGWLYYYKFKNYQTAGYYFKKCIELDPLFPDTYLHYLKLLVTLKMHKTITLIAEKALLVPGVCEACIYEQLGDFEEKQQDLKTAKLYYQKAALAATDKDEHSDLQDAVTRVSAKQKNQKKVAKLTENIG